MPSAFRSNVNVLWSSDGLPLRGCVVCDFGRDLAVPEAERGEGCSHPAVAGRVRRTDTDLARAFGGACGPDAKYLTIKGIEL